jgi:anti-sigma regulatory factor (Ser/Thr protein kinase)
MSLTFSKKLRLRLPGVERPIGGLGIYLTMKMMDDLHYERLDEKTV